MAGLTSLGSKGEGGGRMTMKGEGERERMKGEGERERMRKKGVGGDREKLFGGDLYFFSTSKMGLFPL